LKAKAGRAERQKKKTENPQEDRGAEIEESRRRRRVS
jgi:hypothetical protein